MLEKTDVLFLLSELSQQGIDTTKYKKQLYSNVNQIPTEVLQFLYEHKSLDILNFYEKLRKSYNNKKSVLYKNIMQEVEDPKKCIITLSSLLLQILLYADTIDDTSGFLKQARAQDIISCIQGYLKTYDLTQCIDILKIFKTDIKSMEEVRK